MFQICFFFTHKNLGLTLKTFHCLGWALKFGCGFLSFECVGLTSVSLKKQHWKKQVISLKNSRNMKEMEVGLPHFV